MTDEEFIQTLIGEVLTQYEADSILKSIGILKAENAALRNEADENAALSMENKMRADRLETENAALRERLEKAVELPCIEPMTTWDWNNKTGIGEAHFGDFYQLLYRDEDGEFIAYIGLDKEEAEARLAELKGGKE